MSTLAVVVTAVLLLGLPLAFVLSRLQISAATQQVQRDATTAARSLQARVNVGLRPDAFGAAAAARSLPDRYVSITQNGRRTVTIGDPLRSRTAITAHAATKNFTVTIQADDSFRYSRVTGAMALIGSLALLAAAVAVGLATWQARRPTRALEEIAGAGGPACPGARPRAGPPGGRGAGRGRSKNSRAGRTGLAWATPGRSAAGTGWPNSTRWPRGWIAPHGGSPTFSRRNATSPRTRPTSCAPR